MAINSRSRATLARKARAETESAYNVASDKLNAGMRRDGGATADEWAAFDEATLDRTAERNAYARDAQKFNKEVEAELAALHRRQRMSGS